MLDKLYDMFKQEKANCALRTILGCVDDVVDHFDDEYLKDEYSKNEAIDCVVEFLERNKD